MAVIFFKVFIFMQLIVTFFGDFITGAATTAFSLAIGAGSGEALTTGVGLSVFITLS